MVGGEHRPEDRHRHVELTVGERQVLGVSLDELDAEALGRGAFAAALQQRRDVVGADHATPAAPRRGDRAVAAAAGDVEHPLVGNDVERVGEALGDGVDERRDHREVAFRPDPLLDLGYRFQVRCVAHRRSPRSFSIPNRIKFHPQQDGNLMRFADLDEVTALPDGRRL